jgi:peptide-methionine (S)-S-oxide reductase
VTREPDTTPGVSQTKSAIFGAGSFRRTLGIFRNASGVVRVTAGYCGGDLDNPTHAEVCTDTTGHAVVVRVEYNPLATRFDALLDLFWAGHDPTTINQQGREIGSRFRSVVYCTNDEQRLQAFASRERLKLTGGFRRAIVTEIAHACDFWPASEYYQSHHDGVIRVPRETPPASM